MLLVTLRCPLLYVISYVEVPFKVDLTVLVNGECVIII
jgi:hypothetical protein